MGEAGQTGDVEPVTPTASRAEPRWPMALAVFVAILLQIGTPSRGRVQGWWLFPILEFVLLIVVIIRDPGRIDRRSRAARRSTIVLISIMTFGTMAGVVVLIVDILNGIHGITATDLLGRGAAIWFTNIIVFSLWYWELDRGGPAERAAGTDVAPSFAFPENATPELVPAGWSPQVPRLPVPGIHQRDGVQPDGHACRSRRGRR